jgi:hypothetical protein
MISPVSSLGWQSVSALNPGCGPLFVAVQHARKYKRRSDLCKRFLLLCSILEPPA